MVEALNSRPSPPFFTPFPLSPNFFTFLGGVRLQGKVNVKPHARGTGPL